MNDEIKENVFPFSFLWWLFEITSCGNFDKFNLFWFNQVTFLTGIILWSFSQSEWWDIGWPSNSAKVSLEGVWIGESWAKSNGQFKVATVVNFFFSNHNKITSKPFYNRIDRGCLSREYLRKNQRWKSVFQEHHFFKHLSFDNKKYS